MFVYREEYYLMRQMPREDSPKMPEWQAEMEKVHGIAEVIVAKHRSGPIDNVALQFESALTRFSDLMREDHLPVRRE
jgi:replicative DNA helicase